MFEIITVIVLLAVAYLSGTRIEKRHYKSIIEREYLLNRLPAVSSRLPPEDFYRQVLVTGCTVISVDYFKRFLAALHLFFGGQVSAYETLLDRARREALLRLKESADALGADLILNVKYETSSISKGVGNSVGTIEVLAYGTAMIPDSRT
ncbi:MAG: heavy metal-binding domain-containing protein [Gammaproteobacteria bacterium]|nr:heavy metal-binding domain-containing protein [Gammaproteobacteria bacterium]